MRLRALFHAARIPSVLICALLLLSVVYYFVNANLWADEVRFVTKRDSRALSLLDLTFKAFVEAMEASNTSYFIIGGALIGSWRHHDRIPWDDDIDVLINTSDRETVSRVLRSEVYNMSFGLYDWAESGKDFAYQWKFYPLNGRDLLHEKFRSPYIDIFFYLENETHIWNASPVFGEEIWLKSHVFPLRRRPFGDLMVPAPCNTDAFLRVHYNVSTCKSMGFSHLLDQPLPFKPVGIPCSRLTEFFPFVHRTAASDNVSANFVLETLMFNNSALRRFEARHFC